MDNVKSPYPGYIMFESEICVLREANQEEIDIYIRLKWKITMERKVFYTKNKEGVTFRVPILINSTDRVYYKRVELKKDLQLKEEFAPLPLSTENFEELTKDCITISEKDYELIIHELHKTKKLVKTVLSLFNELLYRKLYEKIP